MARFLVRIEVSLPPDLPQPEHSALLARELERGRELQAEGTIEHLWRVPGLLANIGIWRATTATALHAALTSLPVWPWASIDVEPLADHPLTHDPEGPA